MIFLDLSHLLPELSLEHHSLSLQTGLLGSLLLFFSLLLDETLLLQLKLLVQYLLEGQNILVSKAAYTRIPVLELYTATVGVSRWHAQSSCVSIRQVECVLP